jgi:hypothetical protein
VIKCQRCSGVHENTWDCPVIKVRHTLRDGATACGSKLDQESTCVVIGSAVDPVILKINCPECLHVVHLDLMR